MPETAHQIASAGSRHRIGYVPTDAGLKICKKCASPTDESGLRKSPVTGAPMALIEALIS